MTVTASRAGAYTIEEITPADASDEQMRDFAGLNAQWQLESQPDDPPTPVEVQVRRLRTLPKFVVARGWMARDAQGKPVGRAQVVRFDTPENPNFREGGVHVLPEHRGRGLGKALFARMVEGAGAGDEIVLTGGSVSSVPAGEAFAKRIGAKQTLTNRVSQVELAKIDRAMVREWAAIDPPGYRLVWIDGDVPDELMAQVCAAEDLMNSAPREQMQMNDWKTTPEIVRQQDASRNASGNLRRMLLALTAGGEAAGFTEVGYHPEVPHVVGQHGTAVDPAHRGHGIGKWIKARMIERVLREWPAAKYIRTGNAYSNAPMLSINDRLGFKVTLSFVVWQLTLPEAKAYLARGRG